MSIHGRQAGVLCAAALVMWGGTGTAVGQDKQPAAKPADPRPAAVAPAEKGGDHAKPAAPRPQSKPGSGPDISLKPGYARTRELKFTQHIVRTDLMKVPGIGEQMVRYDATVHSIARVVKSDESGSELEMRITGLKATVDQGMKSEREGEAGPKNTSETYDSEAANADASSGGGVMNAFKPLVGVPLTIKIDANGTITTVSGGEVISLPRGSMSQVPQMLVTPDGFKALWGPVLCVKRDGEPARVGQVWVDEEKRPAGPLGTITFTWASTLKSADADQATVSIDGTMTMTPAAEGEAMAMKLSDAVTSGRCVWDLKAGACRSMEWRQRSSMSGSAQGISTERASDWTATTTRE